MIWLEQCDAITASWRVMNRLRLGGTWVINVLPGDGYTMAQVGTAAGRRLLRSASPTLAGVFDARTSPADLRAALVSASRGEMKRQQTARERAEYAAYRRRWRRQRRAAGMRAS